MAFLRKFKSYERLRSLALTIYDRSIRLNFLLFKALYFSPYTGHPIRSTTIDKELEDLFDFSLVPKTFSPFYVEAGAHDGLTSSNTFFLENKYRFSGLLIEPCLNLFLQCVDSRSNRNYFELTALGPKDSQIIDLFYSDSMTVSITDSCELDSDHALKGTNLLTGKKAQKHVTFPAYSSSLSSLLRKNNCPKNIFFLSLDTEGMELPILKGIDFTINSFAYILVESRSLDLLQDFFSPLGYSLVKTFGAHDHLFSSIK